MHEEEQSTLIRLQRPDPKIVVTMSAYALGRELGLEGAMAELDRQVEEEPSNALPGIITVCRLRSICGNLSRRFDTGGTAIGKTRSRHFFEAYTSKADIWISVDDDVEVETESLMYLIAAVNDQEPRIVLLPCLLRQSTSEKPIVNVRFSSVLVMRNVGRARLVHCLGGGFGCVAMNRAAMLEIAKMAEETKPSLWYVDHDGVERLGLFCEMIKADVDGVPRWWGEDLAFFHRVPLHKVNVEALLIGATCHAGLALYLDRIAVDGSYSLG